MYNLILFIKNVTADINDVPTEEESDLQRKERLKFVMSSRQAKNGLKDAEKELQDVLQTFKVRKNWKFIRILTLELNSLKWG